MSDTCKSCRYFSGLVCQRHAPTAGNHGLAAFPFIDKDEWCGDFDAKPAEIVHYSVYNRRTCDDAEIVPGMKYTNFPSRVTCEACEKKLAEINVGLTALAGGER